MVLSGLTGCEAGCCVCGALCAAPSEGGTGSLEGRLASSRTLGGTPSEGRIRSPSEAGRSASEAVRREMGESRLSSWSYIARLSGALTTAGGVRTVDSGSNTKPHFFCHCDLGDWLPKDARIVWNVESTLMWNCGDVKPVARDKTRATVRAC